MPSIYDVSAIKKDDSRNPFERVTHLCGPSFDGSLWEIPQAEAIDGIRCGRFEFYVAAEDGTRTKLVIARGPFGYYLKAGTDRGEPASLLNLPEHF
ncbi:MAG: DUF3892 domain-containing protein [Alphaproteobacteria bacterium]|nr:MAG: DUF3892 domain-containing protein [Alphaproteobacteria bacterium]